MPRGRQRHRADASDRRGLLSVGGAVFAYVRSRPDGAARPGGPRGAPAGPGRARSRPRAGRADRTWRAGHACRAANARRATGRLMLGASSQQSEPSDGLPIPQRYWGILTIALGLTMAV